MCKFLTHIHTYMHTFCRRIWYKKSAHVAHQTWYLEDSMYKSQSSGSQFSISNCYHNPLFSSITFSASRFFHCLLQSRACPAMPEKKPKKIQQQKTSAQLTLNCLCSDESIWNLHAESTEDDHTNDFCNRPPYTSASLFKSLELKVLTSSAFRDFQ